ncbi:BTAD domain-containing putative transcriptional regulator [Kineococcus aurantiacus]|uniref:Putative ATPase/DNA-binding SARP family transcriptional activator n=1 Tax=Kineococcus aurantiacus TaxID=37633 RepID=A0A7Y9DIE7_9ACTN|nr:putative ATPase/DNA-binding SARP family transcriptional activator [Kineococcus aurantiacus]
MSGVAAPQRAAGPDVEVRVLGAVEVLVAGTAVALGPSLRAVLAALALDAGRVVGADVLAERTWGQAGGRPAASTMHSSVSRLRRALAPAGDVLRTRAPGYQLALGPDALDAAVFEGLLDRAHAEQDPTSAHRAVTQALARWRGPAYADVGADFAREEAHRLEGRRLSALELRARLDLALGRHREVLADLADLVDRHPLHEDLRASLALALYRSSRQAEALAVLDDARRVLQRELGLDPGPQLRRLRDLVLRQDPSLEAPEPAPRPTPPPAAGPARSAATTAPAVPTTSLVGRDAEVEALRARLGSSRLLTLTGTGGVGKTRLAAAVARTAAADFPHGTWFVPLAMVTHAAGVLPAVARAVGLPQATDDDVLDDVATRLSGGRGLLVLDNCEHLLEAATDVAALAARCPDLSVLVTSRAPLRVSGEAEHRVEPLAAAPARELFVQRAQAVAPRFVLDERTGPAVQAVCRAVSGIPLALELAAARVRTLDVEDLLGRLDQALASGPRDLPERQRSVRATLDWSYHLLDPGAQGLFRRIGVFTGGWTLEQLEEVEGPDVLQHLHTLVEHSLVGVDPPAAGGGPARYSVLEPTVQHARRLLTGAERDAAARAHAEAFARLTERAAAGYRSAEQVRWLDRMDREHPNVLAALDWAVGAGRADLAGRLVWGSWLFWWLRGQLRTGRRYAEAVVSLAPPGPVGLALVRARTACAAMAFAQGDGEAARAHWAQALSEARASTDGSRAERLEASAHCEAGLGICALTDADLDTAATQHRRAIDLARDLPADSWGPWIVRLNLVWGATAAWRAGRLEDARRDLRAALRAARGVGDRLATYMGLYNTALVEGGVDPHGAAAALLEGLRLSEQMGDLANLSYFLEALVVLLVRVGGPAPDPATTELLAVLAAAAATARETVGFEVYRYYPRDAAAAAAAREALRAGLGEHRLQQATARGRQAPPAEVVALATGAAGTVLAAAPVTVDLTPGPAAEPTPAS